MNILLDCINIQYFLLPLCGGWGGGVIWLFPQAYKKADNVVFCLYISCNLTKNSPIQDSKLTEFTVILGSRGKSVTPEKRNSLLITKTKLIQIASRRLDYL